jgi:hypothetical protein
MVSANGHSDGLEKQLRQALGELERRLRAGEDCRAESLFQAYPALADQTASAVDLIYTEFAVREELGAAPAAQDYVERFPQWRQELEKQFLVHEEFQQPPAEFRVHISDGGHRQAEHFQLIEEIGGSARAKVYKTRQVSRNRLPRQPGS